MDNFDWNMWKLNNLIKESFSAIKETNLKKERRKNLVPAKVGVFSLLILIIYGTFYCILYSIPIDLGIVN